MDAHLAMDHAMDLEITDQIVDSSLVAYKADQNKKMVQKKINELQGTGAQPLAAPESEIPEEKETEDEEPEDKFKDERIIYNSLNRGACYHAFAWMWCGCFEPKYKITGSYAIGEEWEGMCLRITDSMAYESCDDVQRQQSCCWCILSQSPCCPCFRDMADIILLGGDESHADGWRLKRIHNSTKVYDTLTRIVQSTNKSSKHNKKP